MADDSPTRRSRSARGKAHSQGAALQALQTRREALLASAASRSSRIGPREPIYLASQLASICDVDLKTIHNWCDRRGDAEVDAQLECFRTPGGHLRFRHSSVLRFLGRWGYPIPDALLRDRPHMLVVEADARQRERLIDSLGLVRPGEETDRFGDRPPVGHETAGRRSDGMPPEPTLGLFVSPRWYVHIWDDPYAALVAVGERAGAAAVFDLAVLDLPLPGLDERAWIAALRDRPSTRELRYVLTLPDDRPARVGRELGVVGSVSRNRLDQLRAVLEDQSAQLMALRGDRTAAAGGTGPGGRRKRTPIAPREPIFVASQVAHIWDVDLKTVHNWVERGDIEAFCTPGRHLRFRRRSLLHFLRRYNMAIPEEVAPHRPRVMVVASDTKTSRRLGTALTGLFDVVIHADPVAALAEIGEQCSGARLVDAVVVVFPVDDVDDRRWIQALVRHPDTRYTRVVVVFLEDTHRKDWQDLGAIATVERSAIDQVAPILERALGLSH